MNDTPTVKATISNGYRWRLVLITLMMLGFGAYCVYDWQIGYPLKQQQFVEFTQIKEDNPKNFPEVWAAYAAERGWPTSSSGIEEKSDTDILTQLIMALICLPIGLFFLYKLVTESVRWVAMDETGISGSGGHRVSWDSIKSLDDERWSTKGIAWLHYQDANGSERKLLLDDFKADRGPVNAIVKKVQSVLNPPAEGDDESTAEASGEIPAAAEGQPNDAESVTTA